MNVLECVVFAFSFIAVNVDERRKFSINLGRSTCIATDIRSHCEIAPSKQDKRLLAFRITEISILFS